MNQLYKNHRNPDLSHLQNSNNKPTIGIDLDGVISSTRKRFLKEIECRYDITIHDGAESIRPQTGKSFGTIIEEIVIDESNIYQDIEPIKGCSTVINELQEYYNIKIITHRVHSNWLNVQKRKKLKNQSIKWLNKNNIYFDEFVFPTPKNKSDISADLYIDDRKENIKNVVDNDKIGIMYLRPHNLDEIYWDSWLASSEANKDINYMANNEKEQWNVIKNSLI